MSTSVLFDAPGPKTVLRHRVYAALTGLALIGLAWYVFDGFNDAGQFDYESKWEVFTTPRGADELARHPLVGFDAQGYRLGTGGGFRLSREAEPEIYATTERFGTVLENVVMDPETRELDFDDNSLAENSRGAYPIEFIPNASLTGRAGQPKNVVLLAADAAYARMLPENVAPLAAQAMAG